MFIWKVEKLNKNDQIFDGQLFVAVGYADTQSALAFIVLVKMTHLAKKNGTNIQFSTITKLNLNEKICIFRIKHLLKNLMYFTTKVYQLKFFHIRSIANLIFKLIVLPDIHRRPCLRIRAPVHLTATLTRSGMTHLEAAYAMTHFRFPPDRKASLKIRTCATERLRFRSEIKEKPLIDERQKNGSK